MKKYLLPLLTTTLLGASAAVSLHAGTADFSKSPPPPLQVPPAQPRFYFTLGGGADLDVHATKFISNGTGVFLGLPTKIESRSFAAVHDETYQIRTSAGYIIVPGVSVFGAFTYEHANTSDDRIGRITDVFGVFGPVGSKRDLNANVGNYEAYAGKVGVRLELPFRFPVKPFITASAGGKFVERTSIDLYTSGPFGSFRENDLRLYRGNWVFTADLSAGVEYDVLRNLALGVEGGLSYDSHLDRGQRPFTGAAGTATQFSGVNFGGDRLYFPVSLYAKFRF